MTRELLIGTIYLIVLLVGTVLIGSIVEYVVLLSKFFRGQIVSVSHEDFTSGFWIKVIWGLSIFLIICGSRVWNGRWPHEKV